jgi:hypothetical protein
MLEIDGEVTIPIKGYYFLISKEKLFKFVEKSLINNYKDLS